jgi:hypothetical protein
MMPNWIQTDDPEGIMVMANNKSITLWEGPVNRKKGDKRQRPSKSGLNLRKTSRLPHEDQYGKDGLMGESRLLWRQWKQALNFPQKSTSLG